ncbi:hypothetical protein HOD29_06940 [archaeon]|jgi:hypothetical protein|nr:hypothetical protein [archaeon]
MAEGDNLEKKVEFDSCVSCGALTEYPVTMHIDLRDHYIECAGQTCKICYEQIYGKK